MSLTIKNKYLCETIQVCSFKMFSVLYVNYRCLIIIKNHQPGKLFVTLSSRDYQNSNKSLVYAYNADSAHLVGISDTSILSS